MTNVVAFEPHRIVNDIERVTARIHAYALSGYHNPDVLIAHVRRLRELCEQLSEAMQRSRLEEQLLSSVALLKDQR